MKLIKQILTVVVLILLFLVLYQNYDNLQHAFSFKLSLYFIGWYTSKLPVWLIILIAFACGYAVASVSGLLQRISSRRKIKQLEQKLRGADTAVATVQEPEKTKKMDTVSQTDDTTRNTPR